MSLPGPAFPARARRLAALERLLSERILVLDGAMGTMIQRHDLSEADFRGDALRLAPERPPGLQRPAQHHPPDIIGGIHDAYLSAGADLIETNSFNATSIALADYALSPLARELNRAAAAGWRAQRPTARKPASRATSATWRAPSVRPTGPPRSAPTSTIRAIATSTSTRWPWRYREAVEGLVEGGADLLLVETIFDTLNAKAAIFAIEECFARWGARLPVIISGTVVDQSGRTLSGQTVEAFWLAVSHARPLAVGLNCALGPRRFARTCRISRA